MTHPPAAPSSANSASAPCPVCMETRTEAYVEKTGYAFRKCPACGYVFCHPRPGQTELHDLYAGREHDGEITRAQYPKASSRKRRGFFNALKLLRHVRGRRVLDVGCGGGFVVGAMKALGAREAVGLDLNPSAVEYARAHLPECEFHAGAFGDFAGGRIGTFGFVYSSEVIEHVADVEAYARFLAEVAAPGAAVFITTPDLGSPRVPGDVTQWDVFGPPVHIQFFTGTTLSRLFGRVGLLPVRRVANPRGAGLKMLFRKTA